MATQQHEPADPSVEQRHRPKPSVTLVIKVAAKTSSEGRRTEGSNDHLTTRTVANQPELFTDKVEDHRKREREQRDGVETNRPRCTEQTEKEHG